ncbi:MAG: DNA double-strand break repair nuclease NurA [Candidatus Lokiarchaeota archaeon]|nr:DNA double-strand break repair nuclease NurA [Candidatus Harpocratesius repetitus]
MEIPLFECLMARNFIKWEESYFSPVSTSQSKSYKKNNLENENFSNYPLQYFKKKSFHSRIELLSLDLQAQIQAIRTHLEERRKFLDVFCSEFCFHPFLDLTQYGKSTFHPFTESTFFQPLPNTAIPDMKILKGKKIAAVDGGLGIREYQGLDLTLIKAVVVEYDFTEPSHPKISYFPAVEKDENFTLYSDFGIHRSQNLSAVANFRRILAENSMIIQYIEKCAHESSLIPNSENSFPNIIILDGSVHLPPSSRFYGIIQKFPQLCLDVIYSYHHLYDLCATNNIALIGSVKDSRTNQLRDLIIRSLPILLKKLNTTRVNLSGPSLMQFNFRKELMAFSDYELLYRIMHPGSRTVIIQENREFKINPPSLSTITQDFNCAPNKNETQLISLLFSIKIKYHVLYSYLRLSSSDLPVRFEMFCPSQLNLSEYQKKFIEIINQLTPLAVIEPQCTLPLPQIEAHLRAHLSEKDVEFILKPLLTQLNFPEAKLINHINHLDIIHKEQNNYLSKPLSTISFQPPFLENRHERLDTIF